MSEYGNRVICVDKHEIVVDRCCHITIVKRGDKVIRVEGLPEEWEYSVRNVEDDNDE